VRSAIAAPPEIQPDAALPSLELNRLVERWDEVIETLRAAGKSLLATALEHTIPSAITGRGDVTLRLDEPNEIYERAFESGKADLLPAIRRHFSGVERVALRTPESAPSAPRQRATHESVKTDRMAMLRRKDPVLGAAIEALDLDLIE
jgi:hypothetical protein